MRTKIAQTFILLTILFSCKKRNYEYEKTILGEWKFEKLIDLRTPKQNNEPPQLREDVNNQGYIFFANDSCDDMRGFFKIIQDSNDYEKRRVEFSGTKTEYLIEDDSLKIFSKTINKWISNKINSLTKDTLTLYSNDSVLIVYTRLKYDKNKYKKFDKIIVSSSGCYGCCPIIDICISSNGLIIYNGQKHNKINGLYTSSISKEKYLEIEKSFNKIDLLQLDKNYQANHTDDEQVTVSFIKDGKIIKTIADYGGVSPSEFIWAYTPVRYLYQNLKLDSLKSDKPFSTISRPGFETKSKICEITKSEIFYLFTELFKCKEVKDKFEEKYFLNLLIDFDNNQIVKTDGRYYSTNGKTYDLGYNFITQNNLEKRFRKK